MRAGGGCLQAYVGLGGPWWWWSSHRPHFGHPVWSSQLVPLEGIFWKVQVGCGATSREPHRSLGCWELSSLLRFWFMKWHLQDSNSSVTTIAMLFRSM